MHKIYNAYLDDRTSHIIHETGRGLPIHFLDIVGGLSWPGITIPGAYVVLGKSAFKSSTGEYPIELLAEGRFEDLDDLLQAVTDDAALYLADDIYADVHRPVSAKDGVAREEDEPIGTRSTIFAGFTRYQALPSLEPHG